MWCDGIFRVFLNHLRHLLLLTVMIIAGVLTGASSATAQPYLVIDADSQRVIFHQDAHRRWAPASLTKMMTAYVTFHAIKLQHLSFNSPVAITGHALAQPPSKMGYPLGTVLSIDQAIKIIMVKSANDVAMALGEAVAGSEEAFVALMNSHARRLGMNNTQFMNPNGLPNSKQFTNAVDMVRLTLAIQKDFPQHAGYFKIPGLIAGRVRLRNYNRLLTRFDGTTGMKTGFVCASGYNIVVTAERKLEGKTKRLIAVVLGERTGRHRNARAAGLLHKAFEKPQGFGLYTMANLPAVIGVDSVPADISSDICKPRRKTKAQKKAALEAAKINAEKAKTDVTRVLTLKEREATYMHAPVRIGDYHRIRLGKATGPNPNGLRVTAIGGTPSNIIPMPDKRPLLECVEKTPEELAKAELQKIEIVKTKTKSKRRSSKSKKKKQKTKTISQVLNCIPQPMERPAPVALVPIDGLVQTRGGQDGDVIARPNRRPDTSGVTLGSD